MGYHRAGFEVVGVDNRPQPRYPFTFIQGDAMKVLKNRKFLKRFDAIHASPPCQRYSHVNNRQHSSGKEYQDLIDPVRSLLEKSGLPWVIENVQTAPLRHAARLCGTYFNLPIRRHRLFEGSVLLFGVDCCHWRFTEKKYPTCFQAKGAVRRKSSVVQCYGNTSGVGLWPEALGIDWMKTRYELAQAIPPAYTEFIGRQLLAVLA